MTFQVSIATPADEPGIVAVVNSAYSLLYQDSSANSISAGDLRGGWTDETHLFEPNRARLGSHELPLIKPDQPHDKILKAVEIPSNKYVACIRLELSQDTSSVYIGMLSVLPSYQGKGIGSLLMNAGEKWAKEQGAKKANMSVIVGRDSLIQYYVRRGYKDTGERLPFNPNHGKALRPLEFMVLEKDL